jgi:hypothetical protein
LIRRQGLKLPSHWPRLDFFAYKLWAQGIWIIHFLFLRLKETKRKGIENNIESELTHSSCHGCYFGKGVRHYLRDNEEKCF